MPSSKIFRICKWTLAFVVFAACAISLPMIYLPYQNGEKSTCQLQSTGNCTKAIVVTIDEKSAEEGTSFTLYCYPKENTEIVAVLVYDKSYICHPTNGYNCTKHTDGTFNITSQCAPLQTFALVGDGKQPVTCLPMEKLPDPNADSRKPDDTDRKMGNSKVNVPLIVGVILGGCALVVVAAIVLCFYRGKTQNEHISEDNANVESSVNEKNIDKRVSGNQSTGN